MMSPICVTNTLSILSVLGDFSTPHTHTHTKFINVLRLFDEAFTLFKPLFIKRLERKKERNKERKKKNIYFCPKRFTLIEITTY